MKVLSSIKNLNHCGIRCFPEIMILCMTLKENLSRVGSKDPPTSEMELLVLCDIKG